MLCDLITIIIYEFSYDKNCESVITSQSSFVASFPHPALPLVLLKKFHRGKPDDKTEAPSKEDGDSDFEEIHESVNRFSFTFFCLSFCLITSISEWSVIASSY